MARSPRRSAGRQGLVAYGLPLLAVAKAASRPARLDHRCPTRTAAADRDTARHVRRPAGRRGRAARWHLERAGPGGQRRPVEICLEPGHGLLQVLAAEADPEVVAGMPELRPGQEQPSSSTSRAAKSSIGVASRSRGTDRAAARVDPREAVGAAAEAGSSRTARLSENDPARAGEDPVARQADQGQHLGRRRRTDRRVVLHPGAAVEQPSRVASQPIRSPAMANDFDERDAPREEVAPGPGGRAHRAPGSGRPRRRGDPIGAHASPSLAHSPRGRQHPRRVVGGVDDDEARLRRSEAISRSTSSDQRWSSAQLVERHLRAVRPADLTGSGSRAT